MISQTSRELNWLSGSEAFVGLCISPLDIDLAPRPARLGLEEE